MVDFTESNPSEATAVVVERDLPPLPPRRPPMDRKAAKATREATRRANARRPPPPDLPKRTHQRIRPIELPPAAAPEEEAAPKWRELPTDPAALEEARASVRPFADTLIELANLIASVAPPRRPLSEAETTALRMPLECTLYRYAAEVDPALMLAVTVAGIATMRYVEWRQASAAAAAVAHNPATGEPLPVPAVAAAQAPVVQA